MEKLLCVWAGPRVLVLAGVSRESDCRSSGSGGEGSRNGGEGGVESGGKNGLNSNSGCLNRGREMVLLG
nr:hypothetical protein [Tanacetum cinerariifolium]